jgi:histidine triad (HIT) family protein
MPETDEPCVFCDLPPGNIVLHETPQFYILADRAPLTPGHVLLIPRQHIRCLAELPPTLDEEFTQLKALMGGFVTSTYGRVTFWENGRRGQSAPHAHLHAMAWTPDAALVQGQRFSTPAELRALYARDEEPYFIVEFGGAAFKLEGSFNISRPVQRSGEPPLRVDLHGSERRLKLRHWVDATAAAWRAMFGPVT